MYLNINIAVSNKVPHSLFASFLKTVEKKTINVYLYIRNLKNSRLKPVFRYTIFVCICVGR